MTSYTLSPVWGAGAQLFDNAGDVLTGGKIYTYEAGTTTPAPTYTDPIGNVFNSNPIIADASGRLANEIWLSVGSTYKFVLTDTNDVLIATYDNIPSRPQPPIVNDASSISYEQGYTVTAGAFTVGATYLITNVGSTNFVAIGAAANAVGVLFTATGVGSGNGTAQFSRTVQAKLQESVSVKDFGAVGDGVVDDTVAIQNAINATVSLGQTVFLPAGTYKVTDTILMPRNTQLSGEHVNTYAGGFGDFPVGTTISFAPGTPKSLFVATGTYSGGFRGGYLIQNLYISGNSTNSTGNSIYAIDAELITDGLFRNLAIQFFRTGIYAKSTINNRFEYIRIINTYVQCVLYDGGLATTDVWEQCYLSNSPVGVNTTPGAIALSIRFHKCIFETLRDYGVDLAKENFNWTFVDCYAEDVPAAGSPTFDGAMFRLGYSGTNPSTNPIAYIIGGFFGGANNASLIGDGVRFGEISGAILVSPFFARFNYVLRGNTSTLNNSVTISGLNCIQSTGVSIDMTNKIQGFFANGLQNTGSLFQNANFGVLTATQLKTNELTLISGTSFLTTPDATNNFGRADARFKEFYASSGYVVTTPDGTKNYRIAVDNAGLLTLTLLP